MTQYDDSGSMWYLFTYSTNDNITLKRSRSLTTDWDNADERLVLKPDPNSGLPYATDVSSSTWIRGTNSDHGYSSGHQKSITSQASGTLYSVRLPTWTLRRRWWTQCVTTIAQPSIIV